jgi:hypothetical protein
METITRAEMSTPRLLERKYIDSSNCVLRSPASADAVIRDKRAYSTSPSHLQFVVSGSHVPGIEQHHDSCIVCLF